MAGGADGPAKSRGYIHELYGLSYIKELNYILAKQYINSLFKNYTLCLTPSRKYISLGIRLEPYGDAVEVMLLCDVGEVLIHRLQLHDVLEVSYGQGERFLFFFYYYARRQSRGGNVLCRVYLFMCVFVGLFVTVF